MTTFAAEPGRPSAFRFPMLQLFGSLLHHDDGGVHHGANGNGDATQRHDIRSETSCLHGNERQNDRDRNRQNGDDGARNVPKENQNHQADDQQLFD